MENLKDNFEPVSKARLAVLIDEFFELRFNPEQEQIGIFCKRVSEKKNQVKDVGFEIPDLLVALQLIRRLPAEYDHLVQILYRMKDAEFTHLEVERQLINESGRIQLKKKDLNTTENAYNVGSSPGKEMSKKSLNEVETCWTLQEVLVNTRKTVTLKGVGPWVVSIVPGKDILNQVLQEITKRKESFKQKGILCIIHQLKFCSIERIWRVSVKGLEPVNVKTKYEPCIACNLGKATRTSLKNVVINGEYLARVERELGLKLKSVRTDNGMEFCHKEFEKFLRELGIKSERTTIFTPELNGVSERFNRSSMDAVRTLLQDSGLQPRFWAEALQNYVYTKNRCIHKLTEGKTPIEIWSGRKPSIKHCRIFGSLAYVYVPKAYRNKLQPKAKIGIFMGYAVSRRGYRVWLPKEGKIEESIHVKIDETKNGVQTLFGKIKRYDYAWYQLDPTLKDGGYTKLQDDKTCLPENLPLLDISTWERLEKPRKKSKRVDVYYYPPSKERLRSLNDAKRYCEKNNLAFDPNQFNFKPTTVNTRFDQKSDSEEETSIDSNSLDEGNCIDDIFQHEIYMSEIPKTYVETQNSPDKSKWDEAMSEEIEMMQSRKVWDLVEPNSNMKVLGCRWVYNIKQDEKNNVRKYKSRLVAQGFKQRPGVDFTDVFAPLVNFDVIKFLFVLLVCILGWNHAQIDVKAAYLYGKLDTPVICSNQKDSC
ncbi:Retrovirus-related Pol polyprotein like [Argiope bruennichi]|uniref:Retrovirus-related Pol polyprotein like n=1 Tax=Argiope bruennichi TaxID=94029 RepID=A0A8T0F6E7_ARGBR|nr:Retrovirus-related Pol polyprotein like [Argiope bruennichi]